MKPETSAAIERIIRQYGHAVEEALFPEFTVKTDTSTEKLEHFGYTHLRVGRVVHVDQELIRADIATIGGGMVTVKAFLSSDSSRASDAGSLPSADSVVLIGLVSKIGTVEEWALLGTLKSGFKAGQQLIATKNTPQDPPSNFRKRQISRKIDPVEYQISAEAGGEVLFDEGWQFLSSDLSEIKFDSRTETNVNNLHNAFDQSFAGWSHQGAALRMITGDSGLYPHASSMTYKYVTPDGIDPALRYKDGSTPGLIAAEEVHVFHELTDLIPDEVPYLHGLIKKKVTDGWDPVTLNEISILMGGPDPWTPQSSDRPPDVQPITRPLDDDPDSKGRQTVYGADAKSLQPRRDIRYTHDSNLVGAFDTDSSRYLSVLTAQALSDKYSTNLNHDHIQFVDPHPHPNFRLRPPVRAEYTPLVYNQTAYYQAKEGYQTWIMGATISQPLLPIIGATVHDKGAGRSGEIFSLGGIDVVLGKTQDEEESISMTTMGQVFAHLGADDAVKPHARRTVQALNKVKGTLKDLTVYDFDPFLSPGDAGAYSKKQGAENLSLILTADGGAAARFGARESSVSRKFIKNGTSDGPGRSKGGKDSHDANREIYGSGDGTYKFHSLPQSTADNLSANPTSAGASDISGYDPDVHGRSWDFHLCGDMFLRIGKHPDSGVSWSMDTDGGLLWWLGKDDNGRSLYIEADGGAQIHLNSASTGDALNLFINGNVNERVQGNVTRIITGDLTETIEGSRIITVYGSDTLIDRSTFTHLVTGSYLMMCSSTVTFSATGPMIISGKPIRLN